MRLKEIREENNVKQSVLAEYLHIRQSTYSQYENEQRQIPINQLIKFADYFHVSVDYILQRTNNKEINKSNTA